MSFNQHFKYKDVEKLFVFLSLWFIMNYNAEINQ